jgi:hypothetical protein
MFRIWKSLVQEFKFNMSKQFVQCTLHTQQTICFTLNKQRANDFLNTGWIIISGTQDFPRSKLVFRLLYFSNPPLNFQSKST